MTIAKARGGARRRRVGGVSFCLVLAALGLGTGRARAAEEFPPITEVERALGAVKGYPNAPAVVLFRNAEFQFRDYARQEASSRLTIRGRIKILTEEGKGLGEVEIPYSDDVRFTGFVGRTVLPDGTVVPLPADAKFERRLSKREKRYRAAVAFPAVQVGAILDYRFDLHFDSIYLLNPWFFSSDLATLHSEIDYLIPGPMSVTTWRRDPFQVGIQMEDSRTVKGGRLVRAWADGLPPLPDEPYMLPFRDLATQIMILPMRWAAPGLSLPLMEDWSTTSGILLELYDEMQRKDGDARDKARQIAGTGKTPREQAEVLYRFVRDQIETQETDDVAPLEGHDVATTLRQARGTSVDKALLLLTMLKAVKIPARPVWAARRDRGTVDPSLANPDWFQEMLVAVDLDGTRIYLQPADPLVAFGYVSPDYEGTWAVLPDRKKPETVELPILPWEQNRSRATLKLEIDEKGVAKGSGSIVMSGNAAVSELGDPGDKTKIIADWKQYLEARLKEFTVSNVEAVESPDERKIELRWAMAQREEEALGDELTLTPSAPFGPARQPFPVGADKRRSPILFPFAEVDEIEVELHWPAGWKVETAPPPVRFEAGGLLFSAETSVRAEERSLTYKRTLQRSKKYFTSVPEIATIRALYDQAAKSDAKGLVLSRR